MSPAIVVCRTLAVMADVGSEHVNLSLVLQRLRRPPAEQLPRLFGKRDAPACARLLDQHTEAYSGGCVSERSQSARALLLVSMLARSGLVGGKVHQELKEMVLSSERLPFALLDMFEEHPTLYPLLEPLREAFGDRLEESLPPPCNDAAPEASQPQEEHIRSKAAGSLVWKRTEGMLAGFTADFHPGERVTAVSIDSLVVTKSGRTEPVSNLDWRWRIDNVPNLLKKRLKGSALVIFAVPPKEAMGDERGWTTIFQGRVERIVAALGVPCAAMVPLDDRIRPPGAGLWTAMMHLTPFVSSSLSRPLSLIVGEAGGREGDSHDGRDRKWARNEAVPFATGDVFLHRQQPCKFRLTFDPHRLLCEENKTPTNPWPRGREGIQRLVVLVGRPGSGKSHFCQRAHQQFVCVHDLTTCTEALRQGHSVLVDGRHPSTRDRAPFVSLGRALGLDVQCLLVTTSLRLSRHLNRLRAVGGGPTSSEEDFNAYERHFVAPSAVEGFAAVYDEPFAPALLDPRFYQFLL